MGPLNRLSHDVGREQDASRRDLRFWQPRRIQDARRNQQEDVGFEGVFLLQQTAATAAMPSHCALKRILAVTVCKGKAVVVEVVGSVRVMVCVVRVVVTLSQVTFQALAGVNSIELCACCRHFATYCCGHGENY